MMQRWNERPKIVIWFGLTVEGATLHDPIEREKARKDNTADFIHMMWQHTIYTDAGWRVVWRYW